VIFIYCASDGIVIMRLTFDLICECSLKITGFFSVFCSNNPCVTLTVVSAALYLINVFNVCFEVFLLY